MSFFNTSTYIVIFILLNICGTIIPTIDLSEPDDICAKILYDAVTKYGFFYIINHEVSSYIRQQTLEFSKHFFDLDLDTKLSLSLNDTHWGYIQYGDETTDSTKQSVGDTKEGFYIHNSNNNNAGYIHPLYMQNQWPPLSSTPDWRYVMETYMNIMHSLSRRLTKVIALSLNLSDNYFESPGIRDHAMDLLYLLHYGKQQSDVENGIFGTGEHTDYDLFTILLTDNNPGLQVLFENKWMDIEYKDDALIVNIADTLEIWTNHMFKSAVHRVLIVADYDRYSIPYFAALNYDVIIDCLPNTVIPDDPQYSNCNHAPFKSEEYLQLKLQETFNTYRAHDTDTQSMHHDL